MPNTPPKKTPLFPTLPQEQRDKLFVYGILGFGAWLAWKNFRSKETKAYIEGDPVYDQVKEALDTKGPHDNDSLDIQGRRLDRIAKSLDEDAISRGIRFEREKTGGNELVARRVVVDNLTHDADYYDGIEEKVG